MSKQHDKPIERTHQLQDMLFGQTVTSKENSIATTGDQAADFRITTACWFSMTMDGTHPNLSHTWHRHEMRPCHQLQERNKKGHHTFSYPETRQAMGQLELIHDCSG
jgi:hypothetical protein